MTHSIQMISVTPNTVPICKKLQQDTDFLFLHFSFLHLGKPDLMCTALNTTAKQKLDTPILCLIIRLPHWLYHGNNTLSEIIGATI